MAEVTGLRNNALNYPAYAAPYGVTFPILDADGDLVTGAASLDSEISLNGDTFADCTNEATEIATSSGMYYLLLTAAELTTDVATIIVKTATAGAKTTPLVLYPRKLVTLRSGTAAGGAAGSITLDAGASAVDGAYNGCLCVGTLDSTVEARIITGYTGSSKVAAVTPNWVTTPDSDDTFIIYVPEGMQMPQADLRAINGLGTDGNLATLKLKQLDVTNSAGSAIISASTGSNGHGIAASGHGTGSGIDGVGGASSGIGIQGAAGGGNGTGIVGAGFGSGAGISGFGGATGHGIAGAGVGSGAGISGLGGATGHGIAGAGGGTSGDGINASAAVGLDINAPNSAIGVNVLTVANGAITAAAIATDAIDADAIAANAVTEIQAGLATAAALATVQADTDNIQTRLPAALTAGGNMKTDDLYALGRVWMDTGSGAAGTTSYVNGTLTNPNSSMANARTIANALNLTAFQIRNGSTITLDQGYTNFSFFGERWTLALASRAIPGSHFAGAIVSGLSTGTGTEWDDCVIGVSTIANDATFSQCGLSGTLTLQAAGSYVFDACFSATTAGADAVVDFGALGATTVAFRDYAGGVEVRNMAAGDVLTFVGGGRVTIAASCTAGTVLVAGPVNLVNNGSGQTITDTARWNEDQSITNVTGTINGLTATALADFFDTNSGTTYAAAVAGSVVKEIATNATVIGTPDVNVIQISGDATAADNLETALDGGSFNVGGGGIVAASVTGAVGSVTGAVGSVTGNVGGDVQGNVDGSVDSVTQPVTVGTNNDKTDYVLSSAGVDAILDEAVEGTVTVRQSLRLANAANAGKLSGAGTTNVLIRDLADTLNRVDATVDASGNRTAVTTNVT